MPIQNIELFTTPVHAGNKAPVIWNNLLKCMEQGENVEIYTPYMICSKEMYSGLENLCKTNGENVEIMINAMEKGSNPFGCCDYLNAKDRILSTGVEMQEWLGEQAFHTKSILIDDNISIVGSYNIDERSTYLDTEVMLMVDSTKLNRMLRSRYEEMTDFCKHVDLDGEEQYGKQYVVKEMGMDKLIFYNILKTVIRPIRYLL